jgi:DMSO/TMAO reductase YedYZ molybdopterin-dependent catalytic subunit/thiosulfate reductase cytochrome b subunit
LYEFPIWIRYAHFINVIFITLLIRSGIEILSAYPRLFWHDNTKPGKEWIKFTRKHFSKDKLHITLEEEESFPSIIALPGHKNLGLGRHWHFFSIIFWLANGIIYYVLLFTSDEWSRLIPTSPAIIPQAFHDMLLYATFHFPAPGHPYNAIQQLTYFGVVFILGPFMVATGAAMSPAIEARFPSYQKIFRGRQVARSLHFLGMVAFVLFIIIHLTMVIVERFPDNMGNIVLGHTTTFGVAAGLFALYVIAVVAVHSWATGYSLKNPRRIKNALGAVIEPAKRILFAKLVSTQHHNAAEIAEYFPVNGYPPTGQKDYQQLLQTNFDNWKLKVYGLVENPLELSLSDLHKMHKQIQVTEHSCIQGWTAIGQWAGVVMNEVIAKCKPRPEAKYVVFHSLQSDDKGRKYYEVLDIELARHPQTLLAYEMNGAPVPVAHGAPLRLRVETQLGFKQVKWLKSIEFVSTYENIGEGQGGYREDVMHYGFGAGI